MKFVIVSIRGYEFYLQTTDESTYTDIRNRAAEVVRIKRNLPSAPENLQFGVTAPFDDPRKEEVIDKDLWVFQPTITLATPASTDKQIAGKTFVELREMAQEVITKLKGLEDQNCSVPVRESAGGYTVTTIIDELLNLTKDGLTFLNDWLVNEMNAEVVRIEK